MVPWWSVFTKSGRAGQHLLRDQNKIYSRVKKGIKILAKEHIALGVLRDDLDAIDKNIRAHLRKVKKRTGIETWISGAPSEEKELDDIKTWTLAKIRTVVQDLKFLTRAERKFKPIEEDIEDELTETVTKIEGKLPAPSGTLQEVDREARQVSRDLKIEAATVLRAASRYEGKIHDLIEQLREEAKQGEEEKSKDTIEELLQLVNEIDKKWIPALVSNLDKAKEIEQDFIKNSGLEREAKDQLQQGNHSEAARAFWEAKKPKQVIKALEAKRDLTPGDYQLLKNAYIALRDREGAVNIIFRENKPLLDILIAGGRRKELDDFIYGKLFWIEGRCGATVLDCLEKLENRIKSPPLNKLKKEDKEWLLGLINQKLDHWAVAARHYNASGDYRSAYYCWLRAGKNYRREAELTKGVLQRRKQ